MVQTALHTLHSALHALSTLLLPTALLLAALLVALLLTSLLDRERARTSLTTATRQLPRAGLWLLAALTAGAGVLALHVTRQAVDTRLATPQGTHTPGAGATGEQTVQGAPRATLLRDTTYTRSLLLPGDLYTRIDVQGGWERLLPYLGGTPGDNIRDLREGFTRRGDTLLYSREVTLQTEQPVNLDTSRVQADLNFMDAARGTYNALFRATYTFRNPTDAPAVMRFAFPLPSGGTLSDFRLSVNGQVFRASDLDNGSVWEGQVPARAPMTVQVTYRNQGARGWSYQLGQRREAIRQFDLTVNTDRAAKFQPRTLLPTRRTARTLSSQQTLNWQLRDVITAQDVALVFTAGSLRETLAQVGFAAPAAVLFAALLALAWAWTRRLNLPPMKLGAALLGLSLGFVLGGVLTAYLPPAPAVTLGAAVGTGLALLLLGRAYRWPVALAALAPLTFLTGDHAGLLVTLLAVGAVVLLTRPFWVGGAPRRNERRAA